MKKFILQKLDKDARKQMGRFLVAGCCAVGTDTVTYFLLVETLLDKIGYDVAKFTSFLAGTFVAFVINKFWTFESKRKSVAEVVAFFTLYLFTLVLNVGVNKAVLYMTGDIAIVAFLIATGCSTVANFIGQKFWVFRSRGLEVTGTQLTQEE